jgi:DUF4097 and DUF4098 domain-containing protein YvlB
MAQEKWLVDGAKVIDVGVVRTLKVSLIGGKVDIVGHDEPGARIEVHSVSGKELKVSLEGDTLEVDHPQLSWDNFIEVFGSFRGTAKADVSIMVPREVALTVGVVSAAALVSGLATDATINTVSGDLVIDGLTGTLQVNGVSGEVSISGHSGRVGARTVSGDITASGDIGVFTAESVSGDVLSDITGIPDEVRVSTVSGRVTTRLAPGVAAQYRINTAAGKLQLDDEQITGVHGSYSGKYGALDQHWLDFRANTVSGDISVLHGVAS